jgi:hypothetical protein
LKVDTVAISSELLEGDGDDAPWGPVI